MKEQEEGRHSLYLFFICSFFGRFWSTQVTCKRQLLAPIGLSMQSLMPAQSRPAAPHMTGASVTALLRSKCPNTLLCAMEEFQTTLLLYCLPQVKSRWNTKLSMLQSLFFFFFLFFFQTPLLLKWLNSI